MRFKIEYLSDTADEKSVCKVYEVDLANVEDAEAAACAYAIGAWGEWNATGFAIRDMDNEGAIVVLRQLA